MIIGNFTKPLKDPTGQFCARCGCLKCQGLCNQLESFKRVDSLWPLESSEGRIIAATKRFGSPAHKISFFSAVLRTILEKMMSLTLEEQITQIVFLPISSQSLLKGNHHPNFIVCDELLLLLQKRKSLLKSRFLQLQLCYKPGKSISLQRKNESGTSFLHPAREWQAEFGWNHIVPLLCFSSASLSKSKNQKTQIHIPGRILFFDDVLSTGYTATRTAYAIDQNRQSEWFLLTAARSMKKETYP